MWDKVRWSYWLVSLLGIELRMGLEGEKKEKKLTMDEESEKNKYENAPDVI
jgi:hypothetical protein